MLPELTEAVNKLDHTEWKNEIASFTRPFKQLQIGDYVNPQTLIEKIDAATADDTIVVTDVGQHQLWAAQFYKFRHPRTLLSSGGLGTMGYSMGAAIGGQMGCPDKTVVMFVGDGGFHMNLAELATMASYNVPVKMFIMNNEVLGMVRQWQKLFYGNRFSDTDPHRATDFVKVAEAFGVKGLRINTNDDIDAVLKETFEFQGPVLVDCRISKDSNVLPMIPPGGTHTEEKLVLSVLVDNESGVLQRIASLFSRRAYNISSLTVSETEDEKFSRMTIETYTEPENFRQIKRQLLKLEIVEKVAELTAQNSVSSELLLVKVHAKGIDQKNALLELNAAYGSRVRDISLETFTLEYTGQGETIDSFIAELEEKFGIVELARTGITSLQRGEGSFTEDI